MAFAGLIRGGCGNPSHSLQHSPGSAYPYSIDPYIVCGECVRHVLTVGVGYYYCARCDYRACVDCAARKQDHVQPQLSEVKDDEEEEEESEEDSEEENNKKQIIPCAGSFSHKLQLLRQSPDGGNSFACNVCGKTGDGELYHCEICQFDAHRGCAEIEEKVKVFFHKHPLQILPQFHHRDYEDETIICRVCYKQANQDTRLYKCLTCPSYVVHARCAKYTKSLTHRAHPHPLKLVQDSSIADFRPDFGCDACDDVVRGYHYTCTKRDCDFDLHPLCAILPRRPQCYLDTSHVHRLDLDCQPTGFKCSSCDFLAFEAWVYRCYACDAQMHVDCVNDMDPESEDESEEEDDEFEDFDKFYQDSTKSMAEFGSHDNEAKVEKLSQLVDAMEAFKALGLDSKSNEGASSSLTRQQSVKSTMYRMTSIPAQSETHLLGHGGTGTNLSESLQPATKRATAEEELKAAKEQTKKEKAAAKAKEKEERREHKAKRAEEMSNAMQDMAKDMRNIGEELQHVKQVQQNIKMSGSDDDAAVAKQIDTLQDKLFEMMEKRHELEEKRHQDIINGQQEIIKTQVQSKTRRVPRLVLCTDKQISMRQKLVTSLHVGLKAVQLHVLCEDPHQPHLVEGALGCEINQKVAGDRWDRLQPFLAAGLQVVHVAINATSSLAGIGSVLPEFHKNVWDTQAIELGKDAVPTSHRKGSKEQEKAELLGRAQAEEAAAQWLVSYLAAKSIDIREAFRLFRVRYKVHQPPDRGKGTVAWLCSDHQKRGMEAGTLEGFPVR